MLANEFINLLEQRGLLDQEIIEALRDQLKQSGARATPEAVAKLLVDNEHLTRFQATKLIGELRAGEYAGNGAAADAEPVGGDLGLLEDGGEAEVIEVAEAEPAEAVIVEAEPLEVEAVEVEAVDAVAAEPVEVAEALPAASTGRVRRPEQKAKRGKRKEEEPSVWDSFKIYGVAGIILLLVVLGAALAWVMNSQDATAFFKDATGYYDNGSFEEARERYSEFVDAFRGTEPAMASLARVRVATTQIYERMNDPDPRLALNQAQEVLPAVAGEEKMIDEQPALADSLVTIGENIAGRAERVRETEEKQQLLVALDDLIAMTENGKYVSSSQRQNLATRLKMLDESRKRIDRAIDRSVERVKTTKQMRALLDAKDTKPAYDARKQLLRRFPELTDDPELEELIVEASAIQQSLVKPVAEIPETLTSDVAQRNQKSIVLANRVGPGAPGLVNRVVYFQVRGSVLAFAADTGKNLWRRFVGYQNTHLPQPLGDQADDGVLLSDGERAEVKRLSGTDGNLQWRTAIGEPFCEPQVDGRQVFLSTHSGRLISLDGGGGEAKWVVQMPQPTKVAPGVYDDKDKLYQVGDHSNLYVIDAKNGNCIESFYIGHRQDAIRVPPVPLMGHLFVMENVDAKSSRVHILKFDEEGQNLVKAQSPVLMTGNIIAPAKVQGRRLFVLTDRAEIKVLDVELAAEGEQVRVAATQVPSYDESTATQMESDRSQIWISGTRLNRYELQMSTGRIIPKKTMHNGDAFIAPPRLLDGILFHARVVKGTKGVRVAATVPESGEMRWQTDVGVPVAMLTPTRGGVHAISAQAALYFLDSKAYQDGLVGEPLENPGGRDGFTLRFQNPLQVNEDVTVLLNAENSGQLAVYNPTRQNEVLRIVKLNVGLNRATAPAATSANGVIVPLNNGRIVFKDYRTGVDLGAAFQPAAAPEADVDWYDLVLLPSDDKQMVVGDDRGKLFRVRIGDQLRALSERDNPLKFLGPMAAVGDTLFATTAGPASDILLRYDINALEEIGRETLEGRVLWGPKAFDDRVLLRTEDGVMHVYDEQGAAQWTVKLPVGMPVDRPIRIDDFWVMVGESGWLVTIDPRSGEIVGQEDFGEPLSAVPLRIGTTSKLFVPGSEGVIYVTDLPQQEGGQ